MLALVERIDDQRGMIGLELAEHRQKLTADRVCFHLAPVDQLHDVWRQTDRHIDDLDGGGDLVDEVR
jgi:hypothetical protein